MQKHSQNKNKTKPHLPTNMLRLLLSFQTKISYLVGIQLFISKYCLLITHLRRGILPLCKCIPLEVAGFLCVVGI